MKSPKILKKWLISSFLYESPTIEHVTAVSRGTSWKSTPYSPLLVGVGYTGWKNEICSWHALWLAFYVTWLNQIIFSRFLKISSIAGSKRWYLDYLVKLTRWKWPICNTELNKSIGAPSLPIWVHKVYISVE